MTTYERIKSAEDALSTMHASLRLSPEAEEWLVSNLDPFHDLQLKHLSGFPDMHVGSSIVSKVQQVFDIKKPSALPAGNWQVSIVSYPFTYGEARRTSGEITNGSSLTRHTEEGNCLLQQTDPSVFQDFFPITAYYETDGAPIGPFPSGFTYQPTGVGLPSDYSRGAHRIIGWGYEVYNTTAEIYMQGNCTVWKQNLPALDNQTYHTRVQVPDPDPEPVGSVTAIRLRPPPNSAAEAALLPGSKIWKAREGCYIVNTLNDEDLPSKPADYTQIIIIPEDQAPGNADQEATVGVLMAPLLVPIVEPPRCGASARYDTVPYNMSGAMFTGLSDQTTLKVVVNWYVENFPSVDEKTIVVLAQPSPGLSLSAKVLYGSCLNNMPVGVPVKYNSLGDWFYGAVKQAANVLTPLLKGIPHPVAQAGGYIADMIATHLDDTPSKPKKKKKKNKPASAPKAPAPAKAPGAGATRKEIQEFNRNMRELHNQRNKRR